MKLWRVFWDSAVPSLRVWNSPQEGGGLKAGFLRVWNGEFLAEGGEFYNSFTTIGAGALFQVDQGNHLLTISLITQAGGLGPAAEMDRVTARADRYAQMTREWD